MRKNIWEVYYEKIIKKNQKIINLNIINLIIKKIISKKEKFNI